MPSGIYKRTEENLKGIRNFNITKIGKKRPPFSEDWKRKIGEKSKGRHPVGEFKKGHTPWCKGIKRPEFSGENHFNWKGGTTILADKIRNSPEYRLWRWAVFTRDNFTCIWCLRKKEVSGKLEADHIQSFKDYPELRFAIDNGRTLCEECHKIRHRNERIPKS